MAHSEIMYHYLWWKYEFVIYGVFKATDEAFEKIRHETEEVINTIRKYDIKKDTPLWYVYHRLLIIRASVRYRENTDALAGTNLLLWHRRMICDNEGNKSCRDDLKKRAQCYLEEAIYLYKNLGDKEHEEICFCEKQKLQQAI